MPAPVPGSAVPNHQKCDHHSTRAEQRWRPVGIRPRRYRHDPGDRREAEGRATTRRLRASLMLDMYLPHARLKRID